MASPTPLPHIGMWMQPLKTPKLVRMPHVCNAIVADIADTNAGVLGAVIRRHLAADLDSGVLAPAGVLERVGEQVHKNLQEQSRISFAGGQIADLKVDPPPSEFGLQLLQRLTRQGLWRDGLHLERLTSQPGQAQQIVHQLSHVQRTLPDLFR
jgi:hypothetical protein